MGEFSVAHWLIVALVFVMLFGAKRLPDTARSLGQALRLFKQETSRLGDDDDPEAPADRRQDPPQDVLSQQVSPQVAASHDPRAGYGVAGPSSSEVQEDRLRPDETV
ncbi:Sec-independent protein translocase subunit TatA [Planotetraspora mira]|uniref:Sec-independent protein translocase protein TatA n=1 Tax=Planotetraspora mira TaxID=58121 RepID=A0A8J3XAX5_9ACTN|nr:Sec-independent protein translocase subunit TatA [Planotetraspora mira]GII34011.1 Sec-independent protein translocase protein TatA [Planotetraspora mira]